MSNSSCPFEQGKHYRVLQDISFQNHCFQKGADVIFKDFAYDFRAGITRYWFENTENGELNAWHVFDSAAGELQLWRTHFAEIQ